MNLREKGDAWTEPFRFLMILRVGKDLCSQKNGKMQKNSQKMENLLTVWEDCQLPAPPR